MCFYEDKYKSGSSPSISFVTCLLSVAVDTFLELAVKGDV